jgi:hypothetical protein
MSYEEVSGPELIIQHTGQVFPLGTETITVGRQEDNVLILADPQVSAHHAVISWQPESGVYIIKDLGSAKGTYVNEVRVSGPQILRHGDVIRMGNTVMDLRKPPPPFDDYDSEAPSRSPVLAGIIIALLAGVAIVCVGLLAILLLTGGKGTPDVIIQSPAAGVQIAVGNEIILQATASGAKDITLLELNVDGSLVATSSDPAGASTLTVSKPWIFGTPGEHIISAEASTLGGKSSRPASVKVTVLTAAAVASATPTGLPTETPTPTLTITATPEDTETPSPTPVPPPQIQFFQTSPSSINAGMCATLQWGEVTNATEARIEPDIGGVGTPGSQQVCPIETTTYLLTATGPGGTTQASTTLTVIGGLPDLTVDSIEFDPSPAVAGQQSEVRITILNIGIGAAGAFNWEWQVTPQIIFDGRVQGLGAGDSTVVTARWIPAEAYGSLSTVARIDTDDEVAETDKSNNQLAAVIQVIEPPSQPQTVVLKSESSLDGYRLNDGSGSTTEDILVGNGQMVDPTGELVARGFISFDLSGIPAGAAVENVELRFYQKAIQGDPYGKLGNLVLERVQYGASLDDSAYNTPALDSATLAVQASPGAWYVLSDPEIASWVQSSLQSGRTRLQLRLQFRQETDGDGLEDWVSIEPGGGALGSRNSPQLTITYVP